MYTYVCVHVLIRMYELVGDVRYLLDYIRRQVIKLLNQIFLDEMCLLYALV